jgi:hydroxyacylglutathione hydrolase
MTLLLERIDTEGLAQLSYVIGDTRAGVAAVIDPRRDVEAYLRLAREHGVRITHILETHIHADFVSGAHELKARTGAEIVGGASADYRFPLRQMIDGEEIALGSVGLRALHTPGHTPEHLSFLLRDAQQGEAPFAVFTGDTLFNLDVGRPDLLGGGTETALARQLYHSLFEKLVPLGDRVEVYPCHGAGSACGKSIGDRKQSTIGNERLFNPALKDRGEAAFVDWLLGGMPEPPRHYARLKKVNAVGAPVRGGVPVAPPLPPAEFQRLAEEDGTVVIDARSMLAFGGGHVPGAINIGLRPEFPNWVGWMIPPDARILLVVESERDLPLATAQLFRLGYDVMEGYLQDGMTRWQNAGLPLARVTEWTVHELDRHRQDPDLVVLDVRGEEEFANGFVPGARHIYVPHLEERVGELDRNKAIATYCGSGYRASIAASLLQKHGFKTVINIPGSWTAWRAADLAVEQPN